MIKFFRKIRQRLLTENKFGKYLLYAIGEIILVVIGILIALSINNWNEEGENRIKENGILKELNKDFASNKKQFDTIKSNYILALESIEKIISFYPYEKNRIPIDSFYKYRHKAFKTYTFNPSNGTVESIISSSTFEIIQNDTLRNYLLSWKDILSDYNEEVDGAYSFLENEILHFEYTYFDKFNEQNPENLVPLQTKHFKNLMILRRRLLQGILAEINKVKIERNINEIIRLTDIK